MVVVLALLEQMQHHSSRGRAETVLHLQSLDLPLLTQAEGAEALLRMAQRGAVGVPVAEEQEVCLLLQLVILEVLIRAAVAAVEVAAAPAAAPVVPAS